MAAVLRAWGTFEICACVMEFMEYSDEGRWVLVNQAVFRLCRHLLCELGWRLQSRADHEAELAWEAHRDGLMSCFPYVGMDSQ